MKDFLEKLEHYFATTSKEKILEEWAKTEAFDEVGVLCSEVISPYSYALLGYNTDGDIKTNLSFNPKSTSGFSINCNIFNYAKYSICRLFNR